MVETSEWYHWIQCVHKQGGRSRSHDSIWLPSKVGLSESNVKHLAQSWWYRLQSGTVGFRVSTNSGVGQGPMSLSGFLQKLGYLNQMSKISGKVDGRDFRVVPLDSAYPQTGDRSRSHVSICLPSKVGLPESNVKNLAKYW